MNISGWEIILLLLLLFAPHSIYGQDDDIIIGVAEDSYVFLPYEYDEDPVHLAADNDGNSIVSFTSMTGSSTDGNTTIGYYDGLGRMKEEIKVGFTPGRYDMVTFHEYDAFNRKKRQWQPAVVSSSVAGQYVLYSNCTAGSIEVWNDSKPYTEYIYDNVPSGELVRATGPGIMWHNMNKSVRYEYLANVIGNDTLDCVRYVAGNVSGDMPTLKASGSYASGSLMITRVENEDGVTSMTFKDRHGRTVLSRMIEHNGTAKILYDTYYIYDAHGNLVMIVPPALSGEHFSGSVPFGYIYEFAYVYSYDSRNRRCTSKMPGADVVRTEYDGADRPLFVQTGEQRKYDESTFHIYDLFGRECLTGTCSYNIPSPEHSLYMTSIPYCTYTGADGVYMGYELHGLDPSNVHVLTANYYDDYGFADGHDELLYSSEEGFGKRFNKANGLLTGRATACLSKISNDVSYLYEAIYYDFRQRVIQKKSTNYLKGTDSHYYTYDFSGNEILHRHVHTSHIQPRLSTVTLEISSTYDHAGRLMKQTHSVNGNTPVTIKDLEYDGLCRLKSYSRNGNDKLGMEYSYNVRSWLTGLGGPLISMSMGYENSEGGSLSCYSGNQSSFQWRINSSGEGISRRYNYSYDGLSRLVSALYTDDSDLHHANYDTFYDYDRNGNILSLRRNGKYFGDVCGTIDDLFYEYDGNRLRRVTDAAEGPCYKDAMHFTDGADDETEYDYDANGNLIEDKNKGISKITYNEINLPEHVSFSSGKYIDFTYNSTGEKLCSEYLLKFPHIHEPLISPLSSDVYVSVNNRDDLGEPIDPGLRDSLMFRPGLLITEEEYAMLYGVHRIDYSGDIIYENIKPVPNRILFDGGYVTFSNKQPVYHFYLTDHQGNVRVVADAQGNIEQTNNYYPFGALFGDGTGDDVQRYKYNGKELERLLALDWYDYGARWYDPVLARWHAVDPLAEKYPDISPYVYCNNNAVNAIDPDGRKIVIVGDRQQRISVLGQLQKLTNDKLGVRRSDGMVIILSRGTRNRDKKLVNGTRLVSELINHERSMDIRPSADNSREHDRYQMDALNGKGTDVSIYYNMRQNPTVFTRNPKTGKIKEEAIPSHIVLGHELIHGHRSMNGKAVYWENRSDYTYKTENGNIMKTEAETEELETVGIRGNYTHTENKLRKEQDLNKRIEY